MYLQRLENYIVDLGLERMNSESTVFLDADTVIADLVDILIEEERLIPDFVINHNNITDDDYLDIYEFGGTDDHDSDVTYDLVRIEEMMKRFMLVLLPVGIGLIGFLLGFFTAP